MMPPSPITRAEISRSRLTENFLRLRSLARQSGGDALAVVKADAYGHSVSLCAPWLMQSGAEWLGVTSVQEGVAVRRLCPRARILVLSAFQREHAEPLLDANLTPTVWDLAHLEALSEAAHRRSLSSGSVPVHLEIDTGMSRQGVAFAPAHLTPVLEKLRAIPALRLEATFTHFASPEVLDSEQNSQQATRFEQAVAHIANAGFRPRWIHAGNSSTLLAQRQSRQLVALANSVGAAFLFRPGLALYGYALPFTGESSALPIRLQPVMSWKTAIASLRTVEPGAKIGYSGTFIAPTEMRIALLPIGYADGLNRKLSNPSPKGEGHVLIRGIAAPIVGRVSMDLTTVDVSQIPAAAVGDEVVILGEQAGQRITADDHARWAETISYEVLCSVAARVPRIARE